RGRRDVTPRFWVLPTIRRLGAVTWTATTAGPGRFGQLVDHTLAADERYRQRRGAVAIVVEVRRLQGERCVERQAVDASARQVRAEAGVVHNRRTCPHDPLRGRVQRARVW